MTGPSGRSRSRLQTRRALASGSTRHEASTHGTPLLYFLSSFLPLEEDGGRIHPPKSSTTTSNDNNMHHAFSKCVSHAPDQLHSPLHPKTGRNKCLPRQKAERKDQTYNCRVSSKDLEKQHRLSWICVDYLTGNVLSDVKETSYHYGKVKETV